MYISGATTFLFLFSFSFFLFVFFSHIHRFHFKTCNKKANNIVGHGHGQGSTPVLFVLLTLIFVPFLSPHGGFPVLCFFLEFLCSCLGCPFICSFTKTCLTLQNAQTIAVTAASQVKLCPYDEEEPAIWFCLIICKNSGTQSTLASLPKQVLQDILDRVDVCNDSDQPFDLLKEVLLGQFGKSAVLF